MPVEILIHADTTTKNLKGFPQTIKDDEDLAVSPWGQREGLPLYVILRVTDATKPQVEHFLGNWRKEFNYELLGQNAQGRRYRVSVNPNVVSVFGLNAGVRAEIRDFLVATYGAVLVSFEPGQASATFDIPNPASGTWAEHVQKIRQDLTDKFEEQLDTRRYQFDPADVDLVVASGGKVTQTTAQALSRIIDRLA